MHNLEWYWQQYVIKPVGIHTLIVIGVTYGVTLLINIATLLITWHRDKDIFKSNQVFSDRMKLYKEALNPILNIKEYLENEYNREDPQVNAEEQKNILKQKIKQLRQDFYNDLLLFAPNKVVEAYYNMILYIEVDCLNFYTFKQSIFEKKYLNLVNAIRKDLKFKKVSWMQYADVNKILISAIHVLIGLVLNFFFLGGCIKIGINKLSFGRLCKNPQELSWDDYKAFKNAFIPPLAELYVLERHKFLDKGKFSSKKFKEKFLDKYKEKLVRETPDLEANK